jgi:hypothetical protein
VPRRSRSLIGALLLVLAWETAGSALEDGEMIGGRDAAGLEHLFPPEIHAHYVRGEYRNRYLDLRAPGVRSPLPPPPFLAATEGNRGKYELSPDGNIVSAADGSPSRFITGFPFPDIDPNDPTAARRIVWNFFFNNWYSGNGRFSNEVVWLNPGGIDRAVLTDTQFLFYQSAPEARDVPNPLELQFRARTLVLNPVDVHGIGTISWRFKDPRKRDLTWTYVPAVRRVRLVSPTNRSDGFLGSDLAQDDGQYFAGKPEDFDWRLVGETEHLGLADEPSFRGDVSLVPLPGGGWRNVFDDRPWFGYESRGWTGLPWAPTAGVLVRRPFWVIEGVPKDRYYLYGRLLLRFDKESFKGYWASKYDWKGNLVISYQVQNAAFHTPDGGAHWVAATRSAFQTAENVRLGRATVVRFTRGGDAAADLKIPLRPDDFTPDWLVRAGK